MSLLQKLKSALGIGDEDADRPRRDVGVTVERESGEAEPATETESAVKGTEVEGAAESTDEAAAGEESASAEEGADVEETAAEPEADDEETADDEEAAEAEADEVEAVEDETDETEAEPEAGAEAEGELEDIKGIGPAYAERLSAAGVGTIAELADADAEALSKETDLSAKRIQNWIEQAKVR